MIELQIPANKVVVGDVLLGNWEVQTIGSGYDGSVIFWGKPATKRYDTINQTCEATTYEYTDPNILLAVVRAATPPEETVAAAKKVLESMRS